MTAKRKPSHFIRDLSFAEGWLECSCSLMTVPDPDTFADHRRSAGAPAAWASDAIRTDRSANFMPMGVAQSPCKRGHIEAWRLRTDGRPECVQCKRDLERARRRQ